MGKKKGGLLRLFLVFAVIEVILIILSGNLTQELVVMDEDGNFVFEHREKVFDIQESIEEEFQPDLALIKEVQHELELSEKSHEATEGIAIEPMIVDMSREEYMALCEKNPDICPTILGSQKMYLFFVSIFGKENATKSFDLLKMLIVVDLVLLIIALLIRKRIFERPSQPQILFEMIYSYLEEFVTETLGKKRAHFTPYIVTLFLFIWLSNMIGMIPAVGFSEPTRNLNVPFGLGIVVILVVHYMSIKVKGFGNYLKGYAEPLFFLAPLNFIGELSKLVSIAFRLFGNILGGAIIILVVSSLVKFVVLPVGLQLFFGMFVGTVQAFVFTMLALTYIGVEIAE